MHRITDRQVPLKAVVFTATIVIAPFLALLAGATVALVVLAAALTVTVWLVLAEAGRVRAEDRARLRLVAGINGVLLLAVLVVLGVRLLG